MSEQPDQASMSIREVLEEALSARAWAEPEFRAALQEDPKSIIAPLVARLSETLGDDALADVNVQVHEETSNTIHLVITAPEADAELAEVSGFGFEAINSSFPTVSSQLRFDRPKIADVNQLRQVTGQLAEPWSICWNTA